MKYTFPMIIYDLQRRYGWNFTAIRMEGAADLNSVTVYRETDLNPHSLYLAEETTLNGLQNSTVPPCMICCGKEKEPPAILSECICSAYLCSDQVNLMELISCVARCLEQLNEWWNDLFDIVHRKRGFQSLIDKAYEMFENPIIIMDASLKVICYTDKDPDVDDLWRDATQRGMTKTGSKKESIALIEYLKQTKEAKEPFSHRNSGMAFGFITEVIRNNEMIIGLVLVGELNHSLHQGEIDLLKIFGEFVTLLLERRNELEQRSGNRDISIIEDLFAGKIESRERLTTRMYAAGWQPAQYFHVLQFHSMVPYPEHDTEKKLYEEIMQLSLRGKGCISAERKNTVNYIFNSERNYLTKEELSRISNLCAIKNLRCAISDPYENLLDTVRYKKQTDAVLELVNHAVGKYDDVRYDNLLDQILHSAYYEDLLHPAVLTLRQMDREHGTEYLYTLKTFIENNLSQVDAAAALSIHRTTLLYRLNKIRELTGASLERSEELVHIAVSLHILEKTE